MEFYEVYGLVRGVVLKARRDYYIKGWDQGDWEQEGMLKLHELLSQQFDVTDTHKLRTYFKVKFTNYIKDVVRKQESQKRKFDRMNYEEVSEMGYTIQSPGLLLDELVVLRDCLTTYRAQLSHEDREKYERLVQGESFRGRSQLMKQLAVYLGEFQG